MNTNPYSATADFGSSMPSEPPRTSIMAILSLVASLVCFIPGLPTIGSVLGVFALIGISSSKGRVKGTGLAVAGIVIGLLFSMLQIGLALGANAVMKEYAKFGEPMLLVESGDTAQFRKYLSSDVDAVVTDADIAAFKAAFAADAGAFEGVPKGLVEVVGDFANLGKSGQQPDQSDVPYSEVVPVPGRFANGSRLIWAAIDQNESNRVNSFPAVRNLGVLRADNSILWLVDPAELTARLDGAQSPADAPAEEPAESAEPAEPAEPEQPAGDGAGPG
jgi:hypothetical protein